MEAFGRGLVSEPYLSTVVIGAALIARMRQRGAEAGAAARRSPTARCISPLRIRSARRASISLMSTTTAKKTPDGWRLDGHKIAVLDGNAAGADHRLGARRR